MRILILFLIATSVSANESDCLSRIMYAEARGEPLEGLVAVGQSVINRASKQNKPICRVTGVKRTQPPLTVFEYYKAMAKALLTKPSNSIAKGSDSWNTGKKPSQSGEITRQIGNHVFYVLKAEAE